MPCLANHQRANAGRRNRKLAIIDVGRCAVHRCDRAALVRDLKPDEVGGKIVDRQVGTGCAKGQTRLLKLNEIDARLEVVEVFQIDPGCAEQCRSEMPQFLGIGRPKDRKAVQGVG